MPAIRCAGTNSQGEIGIDPAYTLAPVSTAKVGVTGFWQVPALISLSVSQASPYSILLCQLGAQVKPTSHLHHLLEPRESPSRQLHCQVWALESRDQWLSPIPSSPVPLALQLASRPAPLLALLALLALQSSPRAYFFLCFELLFLSSDSFLD